MIRVELATFSALASIHFEHMSVATIRYWLPLVDLGYLPMRSIDQVWNLCHCERAFNGAFPTRPATFVRAHSSHALITAEMSACMLGHK